MSRCPCCRKNESLEPTCDYYHPDTLTTHLQGKLYGPTGEILPKLLIEMIHMLDYALPLKQMNMVFITLK